MVMNMSGVYALLVRRVAAMAIKVATLIEGVTEPLRIWLR